MNGQKLIVGISHVLARQLASTGAPFNRTPAEHGHVSLSSSPSSRVPRFGLGAGPGGTGGDSVPPSVDSRNEGVRGSNPRVGSSHGAKAGLSARFLTRCGIARSGREETPVITSSGSAADQEKPCGSSTAMPLDCRGLRLLTIARRIYDRCSRATLHTSRRCTIDQPREPR
jgi:hypothetical protein